MSIQNSSLHYVSFSKLVNTWVQKTVYWLQFIFKCIYYNYPPYLKQYLIPYSSQHYLRHTDSCFFFVPRIQKEIGWFSSQFKAPSDWNTLPNFLKSITSLHLFKKSLFIHLQKPCLCFWHEILINICGELWKMTSSWQ